jgi:hypothetical protein
MSNAWTQADIDRIAERRKEAGVKEAFTPKPAATAPAKKPKMNKTEAAYARHLDALKFSGAVLWWGFEPVNIRLADNTFYRIDFMVQLASGEVQCHEVKGFWRDDARVKIKVAASLLPFKFIACRLIKGAWEYEYF